MNVLSFEKVAMYMCIYRSCLKVLWYTIEQACCDPEYFSLSFFSFPLVPMNFSLFQAPNRILLAQYLVLGSDESCLSLWMPTFLPSMCSYGEKHMTPKGSMRAFSDLPPNCHWPPPIFDLEH